MRASRPYAVLLAALALMAGATAAAAAPAGLPGAPIKLGQFSGYVANMRSVSEVGATFVVPRIRRHTHGFALAASWIGAQAPGRNGPFIQIGVNEVHLALGGRHAEYVAFWSDTRLHFHPRFLFAVGAGDTIATSLRHRHDGWMLAIADTTSGVARRFFTHDEARGAFNYAEWLQEDPSSGLTGDALPYPGISATQFRDLRVNSQPPPPLLSQWMTLPHGYRGPIPDSPDSFTIRPQRLGPAAARFWRLSRPDDDAAIAFVESELHWTAHTPRARIAAACHAFAGAIRANIAQLGHPAWAPRLRPYAHALISRQRVLLRLIERTPRVFARAPQAWRLALLADGRAVGNAGYRPRSRLHGPDLAG